MRSMLLDRDVVEDGDEETAVAVEEEAFDGLTADSGGKSAASVYPALTLLLHEPVSGDRPQDALGIGCDLLDIAGRQAFTGSIVGQMTIAELTDAAEAEADPERALLAGA